MKFQVKLPGKTLYNFMRQAGYVPASDLVFYRLLSGTPFPKFHIYASVENDMATLNLHLDQKKPSYVGSHAHGGEYDGSLVQDEAARIQSSI